MNKSFYPYLFLLAILLLFIMVNCNDNDNEMVKTSFEKRLPTINHLLDLLERENLNDKDIHIYIRDLLKTDPNRRSSFYAMRGKRNIS
jgi:hypothetical protein